MENDLPTPGSPSKGYKYSANLFLVQPKIFHLVMCRCESWTIKKTENWRIDAFELWCWRRLLRVPSAARRIKPANPKGNQSWIFIGRTNAEAETPILWPSDVKNWLILKDPDAGKDWREMTEDETVGWHHRLDGHEFEQSPGYGDRLGSLVCCSPWSRKESDVTERLNWTELKMNHRR